MAILRFRPEIWSARLLVALRTALVYGGPLVVNRDWEGEISQAGDTVRVTTISDPTVDDYVPNSTVITPEELTDAQRTIVVDQAKYFAFKVDDVDARQAAGNVMSEGMARAAYKFRDEVDRFLASLYTGAQAANVVPEVAIDTSTPTSWATEAALAYDEVLVPLGVKLDEADVPTEGRYCIVPPSFHGVIRRDARFVNAEKSGDGGQALRNGVVGQAAGFTILKSNNVPTPEAGHRVISAGTNAALTLAEQINKTEAYRPESSFSDAVKGLLLFGSKLIRPEMLATCTVDLS
jgi:N4-gp56 family major capsid protein